MGRIGVGPVVQGEVHRRVPAHDTVHQVCGTEGTVGKARDSFATGIAVARVGAAVKHRQIHQKACLSVLLGFLNQHHPAGQCRFAGVDGPLHSLAPDLVREHVVAESAAVAPVERLEELDCRINCALAGRMHPELGKALRANGCLIRSKLLGFQHHRITDALDAGIMFAQLKCCDVAPEGLPVDLQPGGHQPLRASQYLLVVRHAIEDRRLNGRGLLLEALGFYRLHKAARHDADAGSNQ